MASVDFDILAVEAAAARGLRYDIYIRGG